MKGFFILLTGLTIALWCKADTYPVYVESGFQEEFATLQDTKAREQTSFADDPKSSQLTITSNSDCSGNTQSFSPTFNIGSYDNFNTEKINANCFGVYVDPKPEDQLWLVQQVLPKAKKIGVIIHPDNKWIQETLRGAPDSRLELDFIRVDAAEKLPSALATLLPRIDAIMLFPDERLFNGKTAKHLLLSSYRQRKPVIGPDDSFVTAGSLASVYSSKENKKQAVSRLINAFIEKGDTGLLFSARSVSINSYVARNFSVENLDAEKLTQQLEVIHANQ